MANSMFWKCATLGLIAVTFYLGHGLHKSSDSDVPKLPAAAYADEPKNTGHPIRWVSVDQPKHMPATLRTRVEGGWLVMVRDEFKKQFGITFVPDPDHSWNVSR